MNEIDPQEALHLVRTMMVHLTQVRSGLQKVTHELERRALVHDESKFYADEFAGFSRINRIARENPYGSDAYRQSMASEKSVIDLHYSRNSHHPEHGKALGEAAEAERGNPDDATYWAAWRPMTWLDIVEMVCDWRAAYLAYGSQGTWVENIERQRLRLRSPNGPLSRAQWWLVEQVSAFLVPPEGE